MSIDLVVQRASAAGRQPGDEALRRWAEAAVEQRSDEPELLIRLVDEAEGRVLNLQYRGKDYATNVLSFPFEIPPGLPPEAVNQLGDLVICVPVVAREAVDQGKPVEDHWAHLVIHGVLHLLGEDHETDEEAERMETLEVKILATLNVPNPYEDRLRDE